MELYSLQEASPYPTKREGGKIIDSNMPCQGDMLVPRRVYSHIYLGFGCVVHQ